MTALEKIARAELWRAWDPDDEWRQVGEWETQPPLSELREGLAVTVDYPTGRRISFRVVGGAMEQEWEHPATLGSKSIIEALSRIAAEDGGSTP
ncbi:hypothetical protein [Nocardia asiatica]|uniref:hypothetical protein n=1 Tax=Nocardia asiatica TaxID=209252 RepID=UPI0002F59D9C|nr:hypothetical protein [Nocardia asiatica]